MIRFVARLTSRTIVLLCLGTTLALTSYAAYRYRFRIHAIIWHARHGDSILLGAYRIPVPSPWFVKEASSNEAQIWNAETGEIMLVRARPWPTVIDLDLWTGIENKMQDPQFVILARRKLQVGGESVVCLEKDLGTSVQSITIHLPGVNCISAGQLEIQLFGGTHAAPRYDYSEFYGLVSSIRKN